MKRREFLALAAAAPIRRKEEPVEKAVDISDERKFIVKYLRQRMSMWSTQADMEETPELQGLYRAKAAAIKRLIGDVLK